MEQRMFDIGVATEKVLQFIMPEKSVIFEF